uniref:protein ZW2-like n=1 Tax=Erigeron canadensis TaxID=72917 RepID=UPI001CB960FB|nr:protein ZW2-like [Erigeron canadensis]
MVSFGEYLESWEVEQKRYLERLLAHQNNATFSEESLNQLVDQVISHYQEYYIEKSKAAENDVFVMFSPPWCSSFEKSLLWATGFKPSITFQLVNESVGTELNQEQIEKISLVRDESSRMERDINEALAGVQESVAAPPFCTLVKRETVFLIDGERETAVHDVKDVVQELQTAMLGVMRDADYLRQHTAGQVLEVLTPIQKVKFLAKTSQFWLHSRKLGMDKDRQHRTNF